MRTLGRNKQAFYYALYKGKTAIVDAGGFDTGDYTVTYETPVEMRANISPARGTADVEQFGITTNYTHTIVTDDMTCPIDQNSILWIGRATTLPHNFAVVQVAKSLNSITIAIREVEVSATPTN